MNQSYGGGLLSVAQAAKQLDMATRTVLHWIAAGKLSATKLGPGTAGYVITQAEVDRVNGRRDEASA